MISRNFFLSKNFKSFASIFNKERSFKITYQSYLFKHSFAISSKAQTFPKEFVRFSSNQRSSNNKRNYVPIVIGAAALAGIGIYAYSALSGKSDKLESVEEVEDDYEKPFINETFDEDIKLLKDFGPLPFLIVGAGSTAFAAFRAIRTRDPTAKVLMIGEEPFHPYMRPPLSKELWFDQNPDVAKTLSFTRWNGRERSIFYEPPDYYFSVKDLLENKNGGVSVIRGKKVVRVDPVSQIVFLNSGEEVAYEKCLLTTGARPKNLPIFEEADKFIKRHVTLFRNVRDFQKLDRISSKAKSIAIIGGGFLGSELACGLVKRGGETGLKVIQIFPESGNMGKILPEYLGQWTTRSLEKEGVKVLPSISIKAVSKKDKQIELHLSNDEIISVDHVVVAVGAEPNTEIAQVSGLEIDEKHGGFLVNAEMEARKNLWVAGDASCFYDIKLGRRRVEHHDHAVVSGRLAGENMTGGGKPYWHQSMFWSDLGPDIGYEAIGIVDSSLPTVGVFAKATEKDTPKSIVDATGENIRSETEVLTEKIPVKATEKDISKSIVDTIGENIGSETKILPEKNPLESQEPRAPAVSDNYGKGVIFYLRDNIIVGIVLWNVFSKMSVARKIINESKSYDDLAEVAKLFELHSADI